MTSTKNKHKTIINCKLEVHEVNPETGECEGKPLPVDDLAQVGLKRNFLLVVEGFDRFDCLKKTKEKIDEFNQT